MYSMLNAIESAINQLLSLYSKLIPHTPHSFARSAFLSNNLRWKHRIFWLRIFLLHKIPQNVFILFHLKTLSLACGSSDCDFLLYVSNLDDFIASPHKQYFMAKTNWNTERESKESGMLASLLISLEITLNRVREEGMFQLFYAFNERGSCSV